MSYELKFEYFVRNIASSNFVQEKRFIKFEVVQRNIGLIFQNFYKNFNYVIFTKNL